MWTAIRHNIALIIVGILAGAVLATVWVYHVSWDGSRIVLTRRSPGVYTTSISAVIDTSGFGIGRSDTDMYRLALLAPTYAQLITSEPVLEKARAKLGHEIDAELTAEPVESSPMVKLTAQGDRPERLAAVLSAVVESFKEYVTESEDTAKVPSNLRITIRGVGIPSPPTLLSNRQVEIAVIAFCLPIAGAIALAMRFDRSVAKKPQGPVVAEEEDPKNAAA
jgi:capsular polysaccharide biosynthesis protein